MSVCGEKYMNPCVCVKHMSCVLFCSTDWLLIVAAPSCRQDWPRASLSARTSHASPPLICQLQWPCHALNNTQNPMGPTSLLDDVVLLTHTYHAPFPSLTHTRCVTAVPRNTSFTKTSLFVISHITATVSFLKSFVFSCTDLLIRYISFYKK